MRCIIPTIFAEMKVRRSACRALGILSILSADFAFEAVNLLMDMLNDDSLAVRFQALDAMHHMATSGNLRVQDGHLHMLLGTLVDCSSLMRAAARRVLHLTRLDNLAMFTLCFEGLVKNLEMYPQDEADIFYVLFNVGQHHGKFVACTIQEASEEIEPSFGGKLGYENARTVALLVLSVSALVCLEQSICSIPATIFSYAVTPLGRISRGLAGTLSMNDLLSYLSYCSRFTYVSISEFFYGEKPAFPVVKGETQVWQKSSEFYQSQFAEILKLTKGVQPVSHQLKIHEAARESLKIMLQQVEHIWHYIQCGCLDEVTRTLRRWKNELKIFISDAPQPIDDLYFTLRYLKLLKLLGRIWIQCMFPGMIHSSAVGELKILFKKLDRSMRDMRYRFLGLNRQTELHMLELIIVSCTLKISYAKADCSAAALENLYSTVSCVERLHRESSLELSGFIVELQKILCEITHPTDGAAGNPVQLQKSLEYFSLKQFELSGILLKHVKAELEVCNNSYENPLGFLPGLPVGVPFEIKLYNVSCESRLWLKMTLGEGKIQFVFLDLDGVSSYDEIKKFTFVAPFYGTPKVPYFTLNVCVAMECSSEQASIRNNYWGPKHELMDLCRENEVYLSRLDK